MKIRVTYDFTLNKDEPFLSSSVVTFVPKDPGQIDEIIADILMTALEEGKIVSNFLAVELEEESE